MTLRLTLAGLGSGDLAPIHVACGVRDGGFTGHHHDFVELVLVESGAGVHVGPRGEDPLRAGEIRLLRPGAWHAYARCRALRLWDCCFPAALLDRELAWLAQYPGCARLLWSGPLAGGGCFGLRVDAASLRRCLPPLRRLRSQQAGTADHRLAQIGALVELFGVIAPCAGQATVPAAPAAIRAITMLAADPSRAWTGQGLAGRLAVDPVYLSRAVRAATGVPPMAYLARLRIERALVLLADGVLPIATIGARVGWSDPARFAKRFKAAVGCSAREFRSQIASRRGAG
jgi:AraC family L-rhamnose operon transcriptional activator RhaR